jgi:hypothetical protein
MERRLFGLGLLHINMQQRMVNCLYSCIGIRILQNIENYAGIPHNFNADTGLAGRDWLQGFLRRHERLSMRLPEKTSAARASAFNRLNVTNLFDLLGQLMDKIIFPPSSIYNCDETGISTVPNKPGKIISFKREKTSRYIIFSRKGHSYYGRNVL